MFKKWKNLQRSFSRKKSPTQIKNEDAFKIKLKGIFDIAHKHALKNISENQRELLRAQRLPDQRGFFDENPQNLNESCDEMMELDDENSDVLSATCAVTPASQGLPFSQSTISHTSAISDFETELLLSVETPKINIITPELVAALDRANPSSTSEHWVMIQICRVRTLESYKLSDFSHITLTTPPRSTRRSTESLDGANRDEHTKNMDDDRNNEMNIDVDENSDEGDDEITIYISSLSQDNLRERIKMASTSIKGVNKKLGNIYYLHDTPEIVKKCVLKNDVL